jgi:hypothetical protein
MVLDKVIKNIDFNSQFIDTQLCLNITELTPDEFIYFLKSYYFQNLINISTPHDLGIYILKLNVNLLMIFKINLNLLLEYVKHGFPLTEIQLSIIQNMENDDENNEIIRDELWEKINIYMNKNYNVVTNFSNLSL